MNPLIQLKKATPLFVIALVLACSACSALSPEGFAVFAVTNPTFNPASAPDCQHSVSVILHTTPSDARIRYFIYNQFWVYQSGGDVANNTAIPVNGLGTRIVEAQGYKGTTKSGWAQATYTYHCTAPRPSPSPRPRPTPAPRP
jgi:hypothetical protein